MLDERDTEMETIMRTTLKGAAVLTIAVSLAGCASGGSGESRSTDDILREDLEASSAETAMEVVTLLRPQWLRARPARTPTDATPTVGVVIDGRPRGSLDDLAQIRREIIERISFMSATDATIRWGTGFTGGAIVVTTRRAGPGAPMD